MKTCRWCGAPIRNEKALGGWVHTQPLGQLRVSRREVQDVLADPPRPGDVLHRATVLHPAQPE